jgi:hypothetical protein
MNITPEQIGEGIMIADVTLAKIVKEKKGIFVGFYVNPGDITPEMLAKDYGDVMRIFVSVPDMGA